MEPVPVPGFEGVFVDPMGGVYQDGPNGREKLTISSTSQYDRVSLWAGRGRIRMHVHVLMAMGFLGLDPRRQGRNSHSLQVDHRDGNKRNNTLENLELVTKNENLKRAWASGAYARNGYASKGVAKPSLRRFSSEQVDEMKAMRQSGLSYRKIAECFDCDHKAIYRILRGETYQQ